MVPVEVISKARAAAELGLPRGQYWLIDDLRAQLDGEFRKLEVTITPKAACRVAKLTYHAVAFVADLTENEVDDKAAVLINELREWLCEIGEDFPGRR